MPGRRRRGDAPGPLALAGGEELKDGNEPHDRVLVEAAAGGPAFVLTTAAARQRPDLAARNARRWFAGLGLRVEELRVLRRSDARSRLTAELAERGRLFYLVGGDPGIVPEVLDGTPVWDAVVRAWLAGAAIAGSSAGAMALAEWTLLRERRPGDVRRRYRRALGLVANTVVLPHFNAFGRAWLPSAVDGAPRDDIVLLGIDERSAAVWRGGAWHASGPGSVTVAAGGGTRRFDSGTAIDGPPAPSVPATRDP